VKLELGGVRSDTPDWIPLSQHCHATRFKKDESCRLFLGESVLWKYVASGSVKSQDGYDQAIAIMQVIGL
jgi:hypothetical protein